MGVSIYQIVHVLAGVVDRRVAAARAVRVIL
jgi:hypothetical protein